MQYLPSSQEELIKHLSEVLLSLEKGARSYFLTGQLEQALLLFQAGMNVIHLPEVAQQDRARFLLEYGNILVIKTNFENAPIEEALDFLEEAKQIATKLENAQLLADTLNGIGYAHYIAASNRRDGNPHSILAYFQEALERRRVLHDKRGISESLFYVGLISNLLGQEEIARTSFTQSLQIAQQQNYPREAFEALRHLGFLEQANGNLSQAQQYFTESLQQIEDADMQVYLPFAHIVIADVCLAQGNIELASTHCQTALTLSKKMDIKKTLIFSLLTSGHICQTQQDEKQARDYFKQAYAFAQKIDLKHAMQSASSALQQISANPSEQ